MKTVFDLMDENATEFISCGLPAHSTLCDIKPSMCYECQRVRRPIKKDSACNDNYCPWATGLLLIVAN